MNIEFDFPQAVGARLDPALTTLVVVDMENDFCLPGGTNYNPRTAIIIPALQRLIASVRSVGGRLIYVQSVRSLDALEHTVYGRKPHLIEGGWGVQIVADIAPLPGDIVVQKRSHDCFNNTTMEAVLAEQGMRPGVDNVLVTGVATGGCVACAVSGFSCRDYRVWIPMDCTASRAPEDEALALLRFTHPAWSHNTHMTRSDLIEWVPSEAPAGYLAPSLR